MDYGDSVQKVLLRKIQKAEQDLVQLKLDYCRFIFGLTHRSRVTLDGTIYLVRSVDVDTMKRHEDGNFSKPELSGMPEGSDNEADVKPLGGNWQLVAADTTAGAGH
jgi:hypothetical protein